VANIIGYTTGVFDLFHIGHVNLLKNARKLCDQLIVGVTTDDLVSYKHKRSVIPFEERIEIVQSCKYVDIAIPQTDLDKFSAWKTIGFDKLFVGDDWYGSDKWNDYEERLNQVNVQVVYLPYTKSTSSTLINKTLESLRRESTR